MTSYPTDPTTLRAEARDIEIGAPDGNGYAGHLRSCADRIEALELALSVAMRAHAKALPEDMPVLPDWVTACAMVEAGTADDDIIETLQAFLPQDAQEQEGMTP